MAEQADQDGFWAENLPDGCPPTSAFEPDNQVFYRLVSQFPPVDEDFYSYRKLYPDKYFEDECRARSLSLQDDLESCKLLQKLPTQRNNNNVVRIVLNCDSGVVLQTGKKKNHYSWWPKKNYQPIPNCAIVQE